jgi:hypothetical protein
MKENLHLANHLRPESGETRSGSEVFYAGAMGRIKNWMLAIGLACAVTAWGFFGWRLALGFALGCGIAYVNFHWLKSVVSVMADRITASGTPGSPRGVVLRFLLRYFLMAVGAYVILSVSPASLYGLLAGLFLPVAAIACEAGYEVYVAVARGL